MLEVAETEFATAGYAGAHLQKIAEQVGVQKTALYYYFESKAALYIAVLERILAAFDRCVRVALDSDAPHERRLEELVHQLNDLLAEHPNYARVLIRIFVDQPAVDGQQLRPMIQRVIGRVLTFYREGVDAGVFRHLSSRHVLQSVLGMSMFHYAARGFSARLLGVEDIYTRPVVAWRRDQVTRLLAGGVLERDGDS
jgi:TetR/AcrR family transcriptional regulator